MAARTKTAMSNRRSNTNKTATKRMLHTQNYVYDTAARRLEPNDEITRRRTSERYKKQRQVQYNQESALRIGILSILGLTVALVCVLYICISYLHIQSEMTASMHHITALEKELEQLKSENDTLQTKINTEVDLDYVYKVATEDLGMVYANSGQVLLYDKTDSEYVRQYDDIPTSK